MILQPEQVASPDITFCVACYNEEENVNSTLDALYKAIEKSNITAEVIVIDDASKDESVNIVNKWASSNPNLKIKLQINSNNQGLAFNYVDGAFLGQGKYYRLVCGDNVEPTSTFERVIASMGLADLVLFYQPTLQRAYYRMLISKSYTAIINLISGYKIKYYNGLPLIKRDLVLRWHPNSHGFGFQADLITRLLDRGFTYKEVPVEAFDRARGVSKALTFKNLISVMQSIINIVIRRIAKICYKRN